MPATALYYICVRTKTRNWTAVLGVQALSAASAQTKARAAGYVLTTACKTDLASRFTEQKNWSGLASNFALI